MKPTKFLIAVEFSDTEYFYKLLCHDYKSVENLQLRDGLFVVECAREKYEDNLIQFDLPDKEGSVYLLQDRFGCLWCPLSSMTKEELINAFE